MFPCQPIRQEYFPETLDLKPAWYDAIASEMLAEFVHRTLTAYPPGFIPPRKEAPLSPQSHPQLVHPGSALLAIAFPLLYIMFVFLGSLFGLSLRCGFWFGCPCLLKVFRRHNFWLHAPDCT